MLWISYLVTVMGLVTPWSVMLALIEAYSIMVKSFPLQATVLSVIVSGDFVSYLSLYVFDSFIAFFCVHVKTQTKLLLRQK